MRDARSYTVSDISAPYLKEDEEIGYPSWSTTLEGSRSATGAGAVWLSSRVLPLNATGHGAILNQTLATKQYLADKLQHNFTDVHFTPGSDTNIVSFVLAEPGSSLQEVNRVTGAIIDSFTDSPNFAISRTALNINSYAELLNAVVGQWGGAVDDDHLLVIRMVVMSPYLGNSLNTEKLLDDFIGELRTFHTRACNDR